jgi:hypothetical protein
LLLKLIITGHADAAYTLKPKDQQSKQDDVKEKPDPDPYRIAEEGAYAMLVEFIKDELINNPDVVPLSTLTDKLKEFMLSRGIEKMQQRNTFVEIWRRHLIFPYEQRKLLVLTHNLDRQQLAIRNHTLEKELAVWRAHAVEMNKLSEKIALYLC